MDECLFLMIKPIVWMVFAFDHHLRFAFHNFIKVSFLVIQLSLFADLFPLRSYYIFYSQNYEMADSKCSISRILNIDRNRK